MLFHILSTAKLESFVHSTLANLPSERAYWTEEEGKFVVHTLTKDEVIFGRKFQFARELIVSTEENTFEIHDTITNTNDSVQPMELLYHMNMGYPLLDEDSVIKIPAAEVVARDEHAANDIQNWMHMQKPTAGYQERCYYHKFEDENGKASIYQPKLNVGLEISFNANELDGFVEWKIREY